MSYAIISVGGKQYRVREGETLLVDRLAIEEGTSFQPNVLLVGGDNGPSLAPAGAVVTAKVLGERKGPKLLIGKYKKRTGYKRHTGFRASLTQIEIESIGGGAKRVEKRAPAGEPEPPPRDEAAVGGVPDGYEDLTVAEVKNAVASWDNAAIAAALAFERANQQRKGAIAALEAAVGEED